MKAIITATFEIDVSDWFKGEGLNKKQRMKRIIEDLQDYSVFGTQCDYENNTNIDVKIIE